MEAKRVFPANRPVGKVLLTLPKDQIKMIDDCARAVGMSRSAFLQVYFDVFAERVRDFTEGWLVNMKPYRDLEMPGRKT
jgi:hypothetical protein